jgi:hypothetical protein
VNGARTKYRIAYRTGHATEAVTTVDSAAAERLLARLVAQAFAADHPELLALPEREAGSIGPGREAVVNATVGEDDTG